RLVSEPDRVVSDVSRVAVANLRSLSVYAGKAKDRRSHQFHRLFRPRTAEQPDELASPHSITSSGRAMSVGGIVRPSALAVPKIHECPHREPQPAARKRVMTTIIATCIVPWSATA